MAFTDDGMVMPVTPYSGFGNNGFGDGSWWILLLFILLGGWGSGFGGYGGGGAANVDATVQRGFDQSAIINGLTGINGVVSSGFANAEISRNAGAMDNMQQMFAIQSQLSQCCCDNRLATCQLKENPQYLVEGGNLKEKSSLR